MPTILSNKVCNSDFEGKNMTIFMKEMLNGQNILDLKVINFKGN